MSEIWKALLEVQKEAPALQRDGLNPHFKSSYVTLETVMETVLPILNRHGVVLVQATDNQDGVDALVTRLVHVESGTDLESRMRMVVTKDDAQGYGSAMTYARRYAVMGLLGLVADADDDGNAASEAGKHATRQTRPDGTGTPARVKKKEEDSAFPANWGDLEKSMAEYGPGAWDIWRALGAEARDQMFPDREKESLTTEEKERFWNTTLVASQWLMVKFDPAKFPPPSKEEMGEAWAVAIGQTT